MCYLTHVDSILTKVPARRNWTTSWFIFRLAFRGTVRNHVYAHAHFTSLVLTLSDIKIIFVCINTVTDVFIALFYQRYYWFKRNCQLWSESRPFPIDIMNMVQDTFETIRPKLKLHESYEAASKAAEELGNEFKTKLGEC